MRKPNVMPRVYAGLVCILAFAVSSCSQEVSSDSADPKENAAVNAGDGHAHTNRLIDETSPYLLQHAHNPVNWYPWGEEALAKAKDEDKPIFLSIGYSSCHWCHVMEHESFENEEIAAVMNEFFVSIKVDREERPDLDEIYMSAVQTMTGSGGWPMSVWLTPDLKPFYGGTYFPPDNKFGRPGFKSLLRNIANAWDTRRDELVKSSNELATHISSLLAGATSAAGTLTPDIISRAATELGRGFDETDGGFGSSPKFPSSPSIALLLREHARTGDERTLKMATLTLDKMAHGGMYDHLGGGFARYSTDAQWLVPHFEKMLYDNAQLAQVYLEAYQVTQAPLYRRVAEEIFEYILRDMLDERGGFHSAEDADSEGEEGKFYVWTYQELLDVLGDEDGKFFAGYYNVRAGGNFTSREHYHANQNILHMPASLEEYAGDNGVEPEAVLSRLRPLRAKLLEVRAKRVRPGLDDKVLTSWNALMISAFAQGYQVLGESRYLEAAQNAGNFVLTDMIRDGGLLRTHRKGESRLPAYLDDYAYLLLALIDLYEADFDARWLNEADDLAKTMNEKFWDEETGTYYFTSEDHKNLIVRTRPTYDGATPSGNSMASLALLRLAKFLDNEDYYEKGRRILEANHAYLSQRPRGYLKMLSALDFYIYPPKEIAIAGTAGSAEVDALLAALHGQFVPNKIVSFVDPADPNAKALGEQFPLLAGKTLVGGKAAAYVCKDFACRLPVNTPEKFLEQLRAGDA